MEKITTLRDAFEVKLKALYDMESELVKALPKMADNATDEELKSAFQDHLKETESHVERLEEAFEALDMEPEKIKVEAVRGLVKDAEWIIKQKPDPVALDSMLISAAVYVEHYEMAGYITAQRWATALGYGEIADLLQATLEEEEAGADKLSSLGEDRIDKMAMETEDADITG